MNDISTGGKLLIIRQGRHYVSVLVNSQGRAERINAYDPEESDIPGSIYIGRVANLAPVMNAAFVDCPGSFTGYLKINRQASPCFLNSSRKMPLRPGDRLLVQISNESIKGKNPSLTTQLSITGKYCVFLACENVLCFSARFDDPEKKKEISGSYKELFSDKAGFIIRTNALYANTEKITAEMKALLAVWQNLYNEIRSGPSSGTVYKAPAGYLQDLRDTYDNCYDSILTDDPDIYSSCSRYLSRFQPDDLSKLEFRKNLKVTYDIRKILLNALHKKVWLRSGAFIIIEPTQALTAVDVNTGKYTSNKDREKEFLKINQEAAAEIARQIRLRNLSGIIIIDFINMKEQESKNLLVDYLKRQLQSDPIKTNIIEMTKLDLVEITREKIHRPIHEILDISMLQ